jgi:hypothetical protein
LRRWARAVAGLHVACGPPDSWLCIWIIRLRKNHEKVVADIRVCKT